MATEPLEYRITFDTSEVAQKLTEVKNAMDVAFGAQAFQAAGPDPYPFQQMFTNPAAVGEITAAALPPGTMTAVDAAREGFVHARTTFGDVQAAFNKVAETSRLGYSKFTKDMELTGLLSGTLARMTTPQPLGYGEQIAGIQDLSFMSNTLKGLTGQGYSPLMTMTRDEYKARNIAELSEKFMEPTWGEAGWLATGAAFASGPVGWGVVGVGAASLAAKAAIYPFTADLRHERALGKYTKATSWRFLSGEFNKTEAEDLGKFLGDLPDTEALRSRDYSRLEVDEMLETFTQTGGFDYTRTAQEYKDTVKKMFEGHRELMHALHLTSKEAVSLMGTLSKEIGVEDFGAFAAQATSIADRTGLTRIEATQFMVQSAEMVRGTGYNMKNFAQGAGEMLADVREMAKAGIISPEDIRQFGGENNIALGMARQAMNFAGSPTGFVTQAALMSAQLGGGEAPLGQVAGMNIYQQLAATAGLLTSPTAFLRLFGQQEKLIDQMGPEALLNQETMLYMDQARMTMQKSRFTDEEFYGFLRLQDMDPKSAKQLVFNRKRLTEGSTVREDYDRRIAIALDQMEEEGETIFGRSFRQLGETIESYTIDPVKTRAEDAYIQLENAFTVLGKSTARTIERLTGGIFETEATKLKGIRSAFRYGDKYSRAYEETIGLDTTGREGVVALAKGILGESPLRIQKQRIRETDGTFDVGVGKMGGLGKAMMEDYNIPLSEETNINVIEREVEGFIENRGFISNRYAFTGGGAATNIAGFLSNAVSSFFYESDASKAISGVAESLKMDSQDFTSELSRATFVAAVEYSKLSDKEKKETTLQDFVKRNVTSYMDIGLKDIGDKERKTLTSLIGNFDDKMLNVMIENGSAITREDVKKQDKALTDLATKQLKNEMKDVEPTPEQIEARKGTLKLSDLTAGLIAETPTTMEGRIKAGEAFKQRALKTMALGGEMAREFKQATGSEFSETDAALARTVDMSLMADAITKASRHEVSLLVKIEE